MAGKPKRMSLIKQLLRMHQRGKAIKTIARDLQISKNTVKSYLYRIDASKVPIASLLALEDPELKSVLLVGNLAYTDTRYQSLEDRLDYYSKELDRIGVTRLLLWEEYKSANSVSYYGYSQFCHHLQQHQLAKKPSMVLTHHPGDKLYIHFAGKPLFYVDKQTGEEIPVQVFVGCLPFLP